MDERSFIERTAAAKQKMYAVCRAMLRCEADREDAMQEAVLRAWASVSALREPAYFETWLIRILINECKNLYKKRSRGPELLPEHKLADEHSDTNSALQSALDALPMKYRLIITLHYIDGYKLDEIGTMLRLPKGTVAWRLSEAKKKLRNILGGDHI